jgi:hypothetical protein
MIVLEHEIESGYILPLGELQDHLSHISFEGHIWTLHLVPQPVADRNGVVRGWAALGYSNPEPGDVQNLICYLFPLVENAVAVGVKGTPLVCLHPSTVIPLLEGRYLEGSELKLDFLEDWGRFWEPLKAAIRLA